MADAPVTDLAKVREERAVKAVSDDTTFSILAYDFDDEVGIVDDPERPIFVLIDAEKLHGICMSPADALMLGEALVGCARSHLFPETDEDAGE